MKKYENHYKYLDKMTKKTFEALEINYEMLYAGIVVAHGDKCYSYRDYWLENGISFNRGALIYLLSHTSKYRRESRDTPNGWKPVEDWVVESYDKFEDLIISIEEEVL